MKNGTKVSFLIDPRAVSQRGTGEVMGTQEDKRVIVAVTSLDGGRPLGYKPLVLFEEKELWDVSKPVPKVEGAVEYLGHGAPHPSQVQND